ncbi:hypothetical protein QR680_001221 [Steinernema hermaphroditum]|uniref:[histone H3]-lysine(4) N-trimethyltransferase n=1 Tax=Steinernema hermaphroditum TaxID=289476 RepID=A0AA39LF09_9BILA|nr:hypothetical protein QR680_001221 [Steinernema hermaphroditum]
MNPCDFKMSSLWPKRVPEKSNQQEAERKTATSRSVLTHGAKAKLLNKAVKLFEDLEKEKKNVEWDLGLQTSPIHHFGMFANEKIPKGHVVMEYVGIVIRNVVADQREAMYKSRGIHSTYMFRWDRDTIIDATEEGNYARFVNHSCEANCESKLSIINGKKRIFFVSLYDIEPGEELTLDYRFDMEEDESKRVLCNCGTPSCRKYLC